MLLGRVGHGLPGGALCILLGLRMLQSLQVLSSNLQALLLDLEGTVALLGRRRFEFGYALLDSVTHGLFCSTLSVMLTLHPAQSLVTLTGGAQKLFTFLGCGVLSSLRLLKCQIALSEHSLHFSNTRSSLLDRSVLPLSLLRCCRFKSCNSLRGRLRNPLIILDLGQNALCGLYRHTPILCGAIGLRVRGTPCSSATSHRGVRSG
mmetsp:Transcript_115054/g.298304  ORF Transcript_115054/g.298304 Transcript_115054/m.298304 type:complete len:205 (+) Transcript_115054:3092-3706(+)